MADNDVDIRFTDIGVSPVGGNDLYQEALEVWQDFRELDATPITTMYRNRIREGVELAWRFYYSGRLREMCKSLEWVTKSLSDMREYVSTIDTWTGEIRLANK